MTAMSLNNEELMDYLLRDILKIFSKYEIERIDVTDNENGKIDINITYEKGGV